MRTGFEGRILRSRVGVIAILAALGATTLAACGDDESSQDDYCAAGDALQSSLASLADLDLIAEGTDGLQDAITAIRDDLAEVRSTASDAASGDVDVLDESITDLDAAISDLGGDLTSENASAVGAAIENVRAAASGVSDTLRDC